MDRLLEIRSFLGFNFFELSTYLLWSIVGRHKKKIKGKNWRKGKRTDMTPFMTHPHPLPPRGSVWKRGRFHLWRPYHCDGVDRYRPHMVALISFTYCRYGIYWLYLIDSYLILSYITEGILTSLLIVILCGIIYQYCIAVMLGCISSVPFLW